MSLVAALCVGSAVVVAMVSPAVGDGHPTVSARGRAVSPSSTAANRSLAVRDARTLVTGVHAPLGATLIASGSGRGAHAHLIVEELASATAYRRWTVAGRPGDVLADVQAHLPPGSKLDGTESGGPPPSESVTRIWPAIDGELGGRYLKITVTGLGHGHTRLYAEAQSQWIVTRTAAQRLPAGIDEVSITDGRFGRRPRVSRRVTGPASVGRLVALVNSLPLVQPGVTNCPSQTLTPVVTLAFRRGGVGDRVGAGPPVARATVSADARPASVCSPLTLHIRGRRPVALTGDVIGPIERLLHRAVALREASVRGAGSAVLAARTPRLRFTKLASEDFVEAAGHHRLLQVDLGLTGDPSGVLTDVSTGPSRTITAPPGCGIAGLGPTDVVYTCDDGVAPYVERLADGARTQLFGASGLLVRVGRRWAEFGSVALEGHGTGSIGYVDLQTGRVVADERPEDPSSYLDLDSPRLWRHACAPITRPSPGASPPGGLYAGDLVFAGPYAVRFGHFVGLRHCGTRRFTILDVGNDVAINDGVLAWPGAGDRLEFLGTFGLRRFTYRLPRAITRFIVGPVAIDDRNVYVTAYGTRTTVWMARLPRPLRAASGPRRPAFPG